MGGDYRYREFEGRECGKGPVMWHFCGDGLVGDGEVLLDASKGCLD